MKPQAFHLFFVILLSIITHSPAYAQGVRSGGECVLQREYVDNINILQYYVVQPITGEAQSSSGACASACKRAGKILPNAHVSQLRTATHINLMCLYTDKQTSRPRAKALFKAKGKLEQLKPEKKSYDSRSSSSAQQPVRRVHNKGGTTTTIMPPSPKTTSPKPYMQPATPAAPKKRSVNDYLKAPRAPR